MLRIVFIYVFLIALLITGCRPSSTSGPLKTPAPEPSTSNLPALDGAWTIHMTHSGGIIGLSRSIEISSDGKYTVMDERAEKIFTGEFSAEELSKIKEQVLSTKYIPPNAPDGMGCADCFIYDLKIQGDGEKFAVQLNDISLPGSGLESLVNYLRGLIEISLK